MPYAGRVNSRGAATAAAVTGAAAGALVAFVHYAVVGLLLASALVCVSRRRAVLVLTLAFVPLLINSGLINQIAKIGAGSTLQKFAALAWILVLLMIVGTRRPPIPVLWLHGLFAVSLMATIYRIPNGLPVDNETALRATVGYIFPWVIFSAAWRKITPEQVMEVVALLPALALLVGVGLDAAGLNPLIWQEYTGAFRLTGGLAAAYLGSFGMFGAFAAIWLWRSGVRHGLWLAVTNIAVTFATGTRGASLAALVMLLGAVMFTGRGGRRVAAVTRGAVVAAVLAAVAVFVPLFLERTTSQGSLQGPLSGRDLAWSYFWNVFTEHPLLGNGIGAASVAGKESGDSLITAAFVAPHNTYLQFLVDFGVIGASVALVAVGTLFKHTRQRTTGHTRMMVGVLAVSLAFYAFFDNLLTSPQPALAFTVVLATLMAHGDQVEDGQRPPERGAAQAQCHVA